jgi:signal transduction histidine kinase
VADKVAEGDMTIRTALATGDEFEQLGRSFDEMLEAVTHTQEQLRAANRALDLKLNELAESNVALYESNRLKSEFLANVSHELRTPLNSIIGFADLLGEDGDERVRRYAGNIQTPARMLLRIINDLLDLARIEAGKVKLTVTLASVQDICETLISLVTPLAQKKNLDLKLEMPAGLPALRTDAGKVQQILYNLLSNAIKFTPPGGTVTVRAECILPVVHVHAPAAVPPSGEAAIAPAPSAEATAPQAGPAPAEQAVAIAQETAAIPNGAGVDHSPAALVAGISPPLAVAPAVVGVAVHVIDTGPGVSEAEQTAIFEKFYQSDSAHTREHGGVGLGLAIARDLAEILGGKLSLQSLSGQGATFTLTLPLEVPPPAQEEPRK